MPIPGRPRASATAATTGTARSALTVSTPSSLMRAVAFEHRVDVGEVDDLRDVGLLQPGASGLRSTAATRRPSSFARRIARR